MSKAAASSPGTNEDSAWEGDWSPANAEVALTTSGLRPITFGPVPSPYQDRQDRGRGRCEMTKGGRGVFPGVPAGLGGGEFPQLTERFRKELLAHCYRM